MYRLFRQSFGNQGSIAAPKLNNAKLQMHIAHDTVRDYYRINGGYINNNHILVRLLSVLDSYLDGAYLYRRIEDGIARITAGLGITTDMTAGSIHATAFYTKHCAIVSTTFMDFFDIEAMPWMDIRAVRALTHPFVSTTFIIPTLGKDITDNRLSAVGIDIPLLAYQYGCWIKYNLAKELVVQETPEQFLVKYVIANMLPEQTDIALRNQLPYIKKGIIPVDPSPRLQPTRVVDYGTYWYAPVKVVLEAINKARKPYLADLQQIPMVFADTYLDAVPKTISGLSVYSYWTTLLIFTDWAYPMVDILETDQHSITNISKLLLDIDRYIKATAALRFMDPATKEQFLIKYSAIQKKYGR